MYRCLVFLLLFTGWVIFSGLLDAFHLSLGVISCAFVSWMSSDMMFENRSISLGARMRQFVGLLRYAPWLLWQIVISNVHILKLALTSSGIKEVRPSMVTLRPELKTDFARFVLAQSITLTPGTVAVKVSGTELLVHAISRQTAEGLDSEMERRTAAIFEPETEGVGAA